VTESTPPAAKPDHEITVLLQAWRAGDAAALDQLMPLVYSQLHALAAQYMRREHPGHTLNATALVHEAYLRIRSADVPWEDRAHFFAISARTMRRILVDHARTTHRVKRGDGATVLSIEEAGQEAALAAPAYQADILDLDSALDRLSRQDDRKAKLLEMIYFGGLNCEEAAVVLTVSVATVNRDLKFARAWLRHELKEADALRNLEQ
jgi:RNA polymerase sigma-70 factor (ECF subfamily)